MEAQKRKALEQIARHLDVRGLMECWVFQGYTQKSGHGRLRIGGRGGKLVQAHRLVYELFKGAIPAGLIIRHTCDNAACCNPTHLLLGTQSENVRDMVERGRCRGPLRVVSSGLHYNESEDPIPF